MKTLRILGIICFPTFCIIPQESEVGVKNTRESLMSISLTKLSPEASEHSDK